MLAGEVALAGGAAFSRATFLSLATCERGTSQKNTHGRREFMFNDVQLANRSLFTRRTRRALIALGVAATPVILGGCLMTTPFWNQEFDDHTKAVPFQAFTANKSIQVKFECTKAFHGGLYPDSASATWVLVGNVTPQAQPLLDSNGGQVYGARKSAVLPAGCWRFDPANSIWYAAARATQNTTVLSTGQKYFLTFDNDGLECLGRENGKAASWFAWINKGCAIAPHYAIFRATS